MPTSFPMGMLVVTRGVNDRIADDSAFAGFVARSIGRHRVGDWGNLSAGDRAENERSLREGFRLLSSYEQRELPKIWIITEADRSATTILLPAEY